MKLHPIRQLITHCRPVLWSRNLVILSHCLMPPDTVSCSSAFIFKLCIQRVYPWDHRAGSRLLVPEGFILMSQAEHRCMYFWGPSLYATKAPAVERKVDTWTSLSTSVVVFLIALWRFCTQTENNPKHWMPLDLNVFESTCTGTKAPWTHWQKVLWVNCFLKETECLVLASAKIIYSL